MSKQCYTNLMRELLDPDCKGPSQLTLAGDQCRMLFPTMAHMSEQQHIEDNLVLPAGVIRHAHAVWNLDCPSVIQDAPYGKMVCVKPSKSQKSQPSSPRPTLTPESLMYALPEWGPSSPQQQLLRHLAGRSPQHGQKQQLQDASVPTHPLVQQHAAYFQHAAHRKDPIPPAGTRPVSKAARPVTWHNTAAGPNVRCFPIVGPIFNRLFQRSSTSEAQDWPPEVPRYSCCRNVTETGQQKGKLSKAVAAQHRWEQQQEWYIQAVWWQDPQGPAGTAYADMADSSTHSSDSLATGGVNTAGHAAVSSRQMQQAGAYASPLQLQQLSDLSCSTLSSADVRSTAATAAFHSKADGMLADQQGAGPCFVVPSKYDAQQAAQGHQSSVVALTRPASQQMNRCGRQNKRPGLGMIGVNEVFTD